MGEAHILGLRGLRVIALILVTILVASNATPVVTLAQSEVESTYHYITVDISGKKISLKINPLEPLYQADCPCSQGGGCPYSSVVQEVNITQLVQNETHTIVLISYKVGETTHEVTITRILLWSYREEDTKTYRTAEFVLTEIIAENVSQKFYSLSYTVQDEKYNLVLYTSLSPLDSVAYISSSTIIDYVPVGKPEIKSLEVIKLNKSVTLSEKYAILSEVAKEMSKFYKESGNETLKELAEGYHIIEKETRYLSKVVRKYLQVYDNEIMSSSAILADGGSAWDCFLCVGQIFTTYLTLPLCATYASRIVACATIFTIWWCLGCIAIPCSACIITLASNVYSCCMCAEFMGWIDCPMG